MPGPVLCVADAVLARYFWPVGVQLASPMSKNRVKRRFVKRLVSPVLTRVSGR